MMKSIAKRVLLFLLLNAAVILTVSVILNFFDIRPYLSRTGMDYQSLLAFCLIWGFVGAFISLSLSRLMAKWMMGVEVIDPDTTQPLERQLLATVRQLVKRAGLPKMPEVGVYESDEVNAFATGPSRSRALVAVSSGLLRRMDWTEIEGVLGHEVSHIANGDMVTMTLLQGVVNAFVMFFARVLAYAVTSMTRQRDSDSRPSFLYSALVFVFEIVFMIFGAIVVATYSRAREYRADEGGARLAGKQAMIQALTRLESVVSIEDPRSQQSSFQALKISNPRGILRLFSTHPPLKDRIARLEGRSS
jgi:heat shock protein HtpX